MGPSCKRGVDPIPKCTHAHIIFIQPLAELRLFVNRLKRIIGFRNLTPHPFFGPLAPFMFQPAFYRSP
jgi:hypothetical protein